MKPPQPSGLNRGLAVLIPADGTPEQAQAVVVVVGDLRERIWAHSALPLQDPYRRQRQPEAVPPADVDETFRPRPIPCRVDVDLWILTETNSSIALRGYHHQNSPSVAGSRRAGQHFTTLLSRWPLLRPIPTWDPLLPVCAELESPIVRRKFSR